MACPRGAPGTAWLKLQEALVWGQAAEGDMGGAGVSGKARGVRRAEGRAQRHGASSPTHALSHGGPLPALG